VPSPDGGDDLVGIGGPHEGFELHVVLFKEAVDGSLQIKDRTEHAAFQAPFCQRCEEAVDGIEPRAVRRCEVEGEALMAGEPFMHFGVFVCRIIIKDHLNGLACGDLRLDGVQKADERLMPVALHVPADDGAVENDWRGRPRRRAVPLVILSHSSGGASTMA
jgi:hypothetical protein